jgi:general L-amino acid transport system permease protein
MQHKAGPEARFALIIQSVAVAALFGLVAFMIWTAVNNLQARHIKTGFSFLYDTAGFPIADATLPYTVGQEPVYWALLIGAVNTLKVSVVTIFVATALGVSVAIGRLSGHLLVERLLSGAVDVVRNIPILLQLLFWSTLARTLPPPRGAIELFEGAYLSNRGLAFPKPVWSDISPLFWIACAVSVLIYLLRRRKPFTTHHLHGPVLWLPIYILPIFAWFATGSSLVLDMAARKGLGFAGGGIVSTQFLVLLVAVSIYGAAFISEIVRAGIRSVPKGQWEAAHALGLSGLRTTFSIVLPQAMRVAIPPLTSQYLSIIKDSSLAVAIGYQELVSIVSAVGDQSGQAVEGLILILGFFLIVNLSASSFMERYNRRVVQSR